MNATKLNRGLAQLCLVAGAVLALSSAVNAAVVTQLIHFDDASNGWKWYSDKDNNFLFDPTNLQSSSLCADSTNGGNGSCVIEGGNGVLPRMTRPEGGPYIDTQGGPGVTLEEAQGDTNDDPIVQGGNLSFTLDSFYFLLNGEGGTDPNTGAGLNAITVAASTGVSFTFALGGTYAGPIATDPVITFYEGANAGDPAGALVKDTGYIATFGDLFANVEWIQFSAPTTAQLRLDCVVATFDGTTTEPLSSFNNGCGDSGGSSSSSSTSGGPPSGSSNGIPEPGTVSLLSIAMLGGLLMWRRQRAAA